jgi:RecA-family ATPase
LEKQYDLRELLKYIEPSSLEYQEWVNVGMALKEAGYTAADWDEWSRKDVSRYHAGECFKKWGTFRGTATPVTGGTIVQMARDAGWIPEKSESGHELEWTSTIGGKDDLVVIDKGWVEGREVAEPEKWNPAEHLIKYLETLFEASENVGYVTESWQRESDGKYLPKKGNWDRTAGELIQQLNQCKGDIGSVFGDYNPDVGAWIRFNPLDGKGAKDENVTDFRYALVEADDMDIDKQHAIMRELELPIACLVYSGKKSIHAIVKVDAANKEEFKKRVDYLYDVCRKNGLVVDTQNKNPSRLSRMPGVMRHGHKQFLIDTNIGKTNWKEWQEWVEGVNDDLPEPESMESAWDNLPDLSPPLIDGVLRQGHKLLLAGPSKAGKSYALIELCCSIAEGKPWLNWDCAQGRIMYVNLELDRASCLHRFKDVYDALGWAPHNLKNIDIWNLRVKSVPMDKLAPKLIRRAAKKNYIAIIIDPIYKVITGDENSADQMANFCNQFDLVCHELNAAVIYCHHHSKGTQGQKKSMDRASGSGVFARDPDALLDLNELELTDELIKQEKNKAACDVCIKWLEQHYKNWDEEVSQDDVCSEAVMLEVSKRLLRSDLYAAMQKDLFAAEKAVDSRTAWRVEGTLREFPKFPPVNLWFDYPVHHVDKVGSLRDVASEGELPPWKRAISKRKPKESKVKDRRVSLETAFEACSFNGEVTVQSLEEYMGLSKNSVKNRVKEHGGFEVNDGIILKKKGVKKQKFDTDT